MSMIGDYVRVTPDVMQRAITDPKWVRDYIDELEDAADFAELGVDDEDDSEAPAADLVAEAKKRLFSTYKAWNILGYLLERANCPVDVVFGEQEFAGDDDWGYGPPRFLSPDRVRVAAEALQGYRFGDLANGVTNADLHAAGVYPVYDPGAGNDEVIWAERWFPPLIDFFAAAAHDGDAVIAWLD